jgi:ADP-ribosylglycohydrolase
LNPPRGEPRGGFTVVFFLDANDCETTVINAISLGGDADTMACIVGGIAQAFYKKIPADIVLEAREKLTKELLVVVDPFNEKYKCRY